VIARVPAVFVLLVAVMASTSTTEVLYTLVSPNEEQLGYFGWSVSGAGDVNGDGYDDVVVGAHGEDPGASPDHAGRAYVFDGRTGSQLHTLVSPNEEVLGYFGLSVSGAGDVNGDGYDDVVVGAYGENPRGRAYVFDGHSGNPVHTFVSPNEEDWGGFGRSVSGAGDVNGDGYDDVVVGANSEDPGASPDNAGQAYVFDGQMGNVICTLASPNEEEAGNFGNSVSGAGDVNGDGYDDVVVGAYLEDPGSSPDDAGRAYVLDGQTGLLLHTLVSPNEGPSGHFGASVSGAGDVNGDGYDDVMVGADWESPGSSPGAGRAYVFDGQLGTLLHALVSPNEEVLGYFGLSVSGAGDVNGDGYDDVVVGAHGEDPGASPDYAGRAYVFHSQIGKRPRTLVSPNQEEGGYFGCSVSGAGDVNGDGYDDVVVGANNEDPGTSPVGAGRAYVCSWMYLSSSLTGGALELQWSTWSPASEYWICGASNEVYFEPGFPPFYQHRLDVLLPWTTTWSSTNGIGDPDHNWTYLVIAVDDLENELVRSNYCGEWDSEGDIP